MSAGAGKDARSVRGVEAAANPEIDWQAHPSVNSGRPCPWCDTPALHEQHCKQICLACGWYRSCVD